MTCTIAGEARIATPMAGIDGRYTLVAKLPRVEIAVSSTMT